MIHVDCCIFLSESEHNCDPTSRKDAPGSNFQKIRFFWNQNHPIFSVKETKKIINLKDVGVVKNTLYAIESLKNSENGVIINTASYR